MLFGKLKYFKTIQETQLKFPSDTWQRNVVLREHVGSVTYYKIFTTGHQDLSCIFDFNRGIVWYSLCTGPPSLREKSEKNPIFFWGEGALYSGYCVTAFLKYTWRLSPVLKIFSQAFARHLLYFWVVIPGFLSLD